jgi:hypothetical protein
LVEPVKGNAKGEKASISSHVCSRVCVRCVGRAETEQRQT